MEYLFTPRCLEEFRLLTTEQLEDILMLSVQPGENLDDRIFAAALDVIAEREHLPDEKFDAQNVYHKLMQYWNTPDGVNQRLYDTDAVEAALQTAPPHKKKRRRICRKLMAVAAVICVCFCALTIAHANGINVFGVIAEWTDSLFGYRLESETEIVPSAQAPRGEVENRELLTELMQYRVPEGYTFDGVSVSNTEHFSEISAAYMRRDGGYMSICVAHDPTGTILRHQVFPKDPGIAEAVEIQGRIFYIFTNENMWNASWCDKYNAVYILAAGSKMDILEILNSIEEEQ